MSEIISSLTDEQLGRMLALFHDMCRENGIGERSFPFPDEDNKLEDMFYGWLMQSEPYNNPETRKCKMWRLVVDTEKEISRLGLSDREITELLKCIERYHKELRPEKS